MKASNEEKKAILGKIEEEVEKLKGYSARLKQSLVSWNYFNYDILSTFVN